MSEPGEITADETDRRSRRALEVPLLRFLKASLVDRVDGCWSIGFTPSPDVLNAVDTLHGGVIATVRSASGLLALANVTKAIRGIPATTPRG